jgi:hypothetical protein
MTTPPATHAAERPCPACGAPLQLVWVHGHGQCAVCGTNVVPCCMGAGDEADQHGGGPGALAVEDVLDGFERAGAGAQAITEDALIHALTTRHEVSHDAAKAAIARAVGLRRLGQAGRVVRRLA